MGCDAGRYYHVGGDPGDGVHGSDADTEGEGEEVSLWDVAVTIVTAWTALAVLAWGLVHLAKVTVTSEPAPPVEDDLWVDPAGPFGWMRPTE